MYRMYICIYKCTTYIQTYTQVAGKLGAAIKTQQVTGSMSQVPQNKLNPNP